MNQKLVRIFLAVGLIFSMGLLNACAPNAQEGDTVIEEDLTQPDEQGGEAEEGQEGEEDAN